MTLYIIYKHKNKINGKCYNGSTSAKKAKYRWKNGKGYGKDQPKFYNAIQKYGWNNFEHIIVGYADCEELALAEEEYQISKDNSVDNGYNIVKYPTLGGLHNNNLKRKPKTEEQKKIQSIKMSGENNPFFGKTHTQETINKLKLNPSTNRSLTVEQVNCIKVEKGTYRSIAKKYNTYCSTVSRIKNGQWYKC